MLNMYVQWNVFCHCCERLYINLETQKMYRCVSLILVLCWVYYLHSDLKRQPKPLILHDVKVYIR